MKVSLKIVDETNWLNCVNLEVEKEQEGFVQSNCFSLLQYHYDKRNYPMAVYAEETMVGFLMYFYDEEFKAYRLRRFMIDMEYQGKGYGKAALIEFFNILRNEHKADKVYTSLKPDNHGAKKLYEKAGYKATGEMKWNEEILLAEI